MSRELLSLPYYEALTQATPREYLAASFDAIAAADGDLGAFLHFDRELAESQLSSGGTFPVGVKDNILVRGSRATCGSRILESFVAPYDATAVTRLLRGRH